MAKLVGVGHATTRPNGILDRAVSAELVEYALAARGLHAQFAHAFRADCRDDCIDFPED